MRNKTFQGDINLFKDKLNNKENFAFTRYSDGELYILKGLELKLSNGTIQIGDKEQYGPYQSQEFKHFDPKIHNEFRDKLIEAFQFKSENYFKGISCRCCMPEEDFKYQLELHGGDDDSLTWSNLFVNANYYKFVFEILPIFYSRKVVFVGHHDADISKLPYVVKDFRVGYNAMINDYNVINEMKEWIKQNDIKDHIFLFSASTFSNLAIYELFKEFKNNTYLDIGTCLTPMMNMPTERHYIQEFWYGIPLRDLKKVCIW